MTFSQDPTELRRIQCWMQAVITHPQGVEAGIDSPNSREQIDVNVEQVEHVICRSQTQSSVDRLRVYANAYFARLLEVLETEFPAVVHALEKPLFQEFAFGYLQLLPSQSYTLGDLGSRFPGHLARTRPSRETDDEEPDWADFLIDLATLERAYSEVFDGPGVEGQTLLQSNSLLEIPVDRWETMRLVPAPCVRLMKFRFPVHDYATAVRRQQSPALPAPQPTWLIITRRDFVVRRVAVSASEFIALKTLVNGGTIGESLFAAQATWPGDFGSLAQEVRRWFFQWSAAGYFLGLKGLGCAP